MSRFQFVADHQHPFEVKRLCESVQVERSSYYAWKAAAPAREARAAADAELTSRIRVVHEEDSTMGAPRITADCSGGSRGTTSADTTWCGYRSPIAYEALTAATLPSAA